MAYTSTTWNLEYCYQEDKDMMKNKRDRDKKDERRMHHEEKVNAPNNLKDQSTGVKEEGEMPTGSYRNMEATCVVWKTKIELFKTRVNEFEPKKELKNESSKCKNLVDVSRKLMLKVEDISNMRMVEKWKKRMKVVLPSNMINEIPNKNIKPEQSNKGREKNNIVNEIIKRPEKKKWINGYKVVKPLKSKKEGRKYILNRFGKIRSNHVIYEFRTQKIASNERLIILLLKDYSSTTTWVIIESGWV
ncbi:hypothetical protein C2G38_2224467 [Gigaspora rosea]|uniref:Uncharacterized protein n=1 Tax=Gigaspora rosea TaxID=44941 RepID=A0A397U3C5_9GLOM|nr:hypothetical protein C2G38_2224467 [Gigaspora rosea]